MELISLAMGIIVMKILDIIIPATTLGVGTILDLMDALIPAPGNAPWKGTPLHAAR